MTYARSKSVDNFISYVVEDNGADRKNRRNASRNGYRFRSTAIMKERVQLLREAGAEIGSLEIFDLKDVQGKAKGTRVVMKLPLIQGLAD